MAHSLDELGIDYGYEDRKISFVEPAKNRKYTPDFSLPNGIIIETKGIFSSDDRKKHLLIKEQHPELDIRFVFSNANAKIYKGSKTRHRDWCEKNGFKWSHRHIPKEWLAE